MMRWFWMGAGLFLAGLFAKRYINHKAKKKADDIWAVRRKEIVRVHERAKALLDTGEKYEEMGMTKDAIECYKESQVLSAKVRGALEQFEAETGESYAESEMSEESA